MKPVPDYIRFIRVLSAMGLSAADIARSYDVATMSAQAVRRLLRGETYGGSGKVCVDDRTVASEVLRRVRRTLVRVRSTGPRQPHAGICEALRTSGEYQSASDDVQRLMKIAMRRAMMSWSKYSGDPVYPVPGGPDAYMENRDKWLRLTEYGRLRWELLDWVIQEVTE